MSVPFLRGDLMAGYCYFSHDQMTLLGIEVHSDELAENCEDKVPLTEWNWFSLNTGSDNTPS
jgi:hypothetical protein